MDLTDILPLLGGREALETHLGARDFFAAPGHIDFQITVMGGTTGALVRIIPAGGVYTVFFIPVEGGFAGMPDRFDLTATELSAMFQRMLQLSASQGASKGNKGH